MKRELTRTMRKSVFCAIVMMMTFTLKSFSAAHLTVSITNCTITANEFQFDYLLLNDGDQSLKFNSATFRLQHSASIVPAGSNTYLFSYVPGTSDFPAAFTNPPTTYNTLYTSASRLMQLTMSTGNYTEGTAVTLPIGGPALRVGRFSLKITNTNWVPGQSVGLTFSGTNGAVLYANGQTTSTSFNTTTTSSTTINAPCSLTTPVGCNVTSAVSGNTPVTCFSGSNGSATVDLTNATAPISWQLNSVAQPGTGVSNTFNNLTAGNYTAAYSDANGCTGTQTFTIGGPTAALSMGSCSHTDVTCNGGSDGSVTAGSISNSVGTVNYTWKNSGNTTVGTTATVSTLPAGTYTLTVTDDCSSTTCTQTIAQPPALSMTACSHTDATCNGTSTGSVSAGTVSNNIGTINYNWKNSGNTTVGTTATVNNLPAGVYTLTVTDDCGSTTCTQTIGQPGILSMTACSHTDVNCNGGSTGSVSAGTVSNNVGTINYNWKNSGNTTVGTTATVNNLPAGTYTLTVTDNCGSTTCTQTIIQPANGISMTACSHTDVACFGGSTGSVSAGTVSNNSGTIVYNWKNSGNTTVGTTATVNNLPAGTYTLTVTDNCGSTSCTQTIIQPAGALSMSACSHTDATCNGTSTGSVSAGTVSNNVGTINYNWKNSGNTSVGTTATVNNLPAGTYTLTVTDNCGSTTCTQTIAQPAALSMTACSHTDAGCNGASTGSVSAGTVSNNIGTINYNWKNSGNTTVGTTATVNNLPAGTYTLTVTDNCGSTTCTQTIAQPAALSMTACNHTNVTCFGASTGSVSAGTVSNNVGTINYNWKNAGNTTVGTTATVNNLPAGTYTLTVTDNCGSTTCTQTITQPAGALSMTSCSHTDVTCGGGSTGSVSAGTVSNNVGTIVYNWKNSGNTTVGTTATVNNLPAGTYTLTVTDNCGSTTCTETIAAGATLSMTACSHTDATCFGTSTGSVSAGTVTNNTGTVNYNWKNSGNTSVGTTATVNNLPAGTYTLTVTDNCGSTTCTQTIAQPPALSMTACSHTNVTCNGGTDGSVSAGTVSNNIGTINYNWKNAGNTTVGTTATVNNLPFGTYTLTVTDNCGSTTCTQTITQPAALSMTACSHTNVSCGGGSTGSVTAGTVSNNVGTINYNWKNAGNTTVGTTATVNNLPAGTYTLTVTDNCGSTTCTQTITEGGVLQMTACSHTDVNCFGASTGSVSAGTVSGSSGSVSYNWKNSGNTTVGTTATVNNLPAGTYTLTVTDNCGSTTCTQTILQPAGALSMTACSHTDVTCGGQNNGSVSAGTVTNNVGTIVYNWKNAGNTTVGTTATVNNLPAGTYTLTVTDNCGSTTCTQTITQPSAISMTACSHTNATCNGTSTGSVSAGTVTNNVGTVNYTWKNSGNTTVGTTATVNNLPAGTYTLTVTDNCGSTTCTQTITQPGVLSMTACSHTNETCAGGNGSVSAGTVTNSVGTVSYNWKNSGNTTVGTTPTVNNLTAGTYTLTVTDECGSTTCTQTITAAAQLSMTACSHTDVSCGGGSTGSVSAGTVTNSSGTVNYNWKNSGNTTVGTTATVNNLPAGTYTLTVTDNCGSVTCSQTIAQSSNVLNMDACSHTDVNCNGASTGSVSAGVVTGNSGTIHYSWKNSGNTTVGTTATVNNLPAGTYTLTVTDNCGSVTCTQTILQPANAMSMSACSHVDATCGGTGSVSAGTVINNVGTVNYTWKNSGNTTVGTTATVNNLPAGTYTLTVTDNCGFVTCSQTISQPSTITGQTSTTPTGCGQTNGTATVTPNGGQPNYTYSWSPGGQTTQTATNLAGGTYVVTITDANGCTGTATAVVQSSGGTPPTPGPISGPPGVCKGQCGVVFSIAPVQGATSYVWTLPNGATGHSTGTSITVCFTTRYRGGFICVRAVSSCGQSSNVCISVPRINSKPHTPGNITGPLSLCPGQTATYSIAPVATASGYQWTVTGGLVIGSGQGTTSITVTAPAGFISGSIKVKAMNCKGSSGTRTIVVHGLPSTPIWKYNPPKFACGGHCYIFNIDNVQDAVSWTITAPQGATITSPPVQGSSNPLTTTKSIVTICFPQGFVSGTITIVSTNNCGQSAPLTYNISSTPPAPPFISGHDNGVCNSNNNSYSIPAVPGATSYTWTVPNGAQITQNHGSSIKVKYLSNFISGNVCVKVNNACGSSPQTCLPVNAAPKNPSVIDGPTSVCKSQTNVAYSNPGRYGATSFVWSITGGAQITNGQGSRNIKVKFTNTTTPTVVLSVRAVNACGTSSLTNLTINVNPNCRVTGEESDMISVENFNAYPNPATSKATISFTTDKAAKYSVKVTDLLGKTMIAEDISAVEGYNMTELNLEAIARGIYIVTIQSEGTDAKSIRLVVE